MQITKEQLENAKRYQNSLEVALLGLDKYCAKYAIVTGQLQSIERLFNMFGVV